MTNEFVIFLILIAIILALIFSFKGKAAAIRSQYVMIFFALIILLLPIYSNINYFSGDNNIKITSDNTSKNAIDNIKNSYTIISILLGLALGYFYYQNKRYYDEFNTNKDRLRKKIQYITDCLNKYNESVLLLICLRFENEKELKYIRMEVEHLFEDVQLLLEENNDLFEFSDCEIKIILDVNAFVDKNKFLTRMDFKELHELKKNFINKIHDEYSEKLNAAKRICYKKNI